MGADLAIQFMLMTLFSVVSEMSGDPTGFRSDVHKALVDITATYKLPPLPEGAQPKIRAAAKRIIDGVMLNSGGDFTPRRTSGRGR
ncbi:MAG: hypothetical protein JWP25_7101 [Bradyrhizobium sp.]|jgi:hypothetical protein|nr:hypothetical protein [Bradyrhizobium sp.]